MFPGARIKGMISSANLTALTIVNSFSLYRNRGIGGPGGAYDNEEDAARTYDLAALKYWGPASYLEAYTKELEEMQKLTKEEYLASLRRRSSGFSRGVSKYRGVARHHHNGRWEARIGRVCGNKYLYLGTYSTQEEAAAAYDMAAIEFRGPNAVTNFDISNYANKVQVSQEEIQVKHEMNPIPISNKVQADEAHDNQDDASQVVQSSIPKLETIDSIDSHGIAVMDPSYDHEHPWDLSLDIGFNILQIPDIPLEKASEVFDYKGFEDNIECMFDERFDDNELLQDEMLGSIGCKAEADSLAARDLKGQDDSASLSSSPLSTTTSVCSNL
ncbi:hypothetical protein DH2020_002958 [Rehmannia glutinosa]|uniref:AP2/ERF domain-containing protein n=1 Tax=Rehmannia glutinosa TaxID=99300 RepID=A0ABR0XV89_REHGL